MKHVARWAVSPKGQVTHLLLRDGDHPDGVLRARCGEELPTTVVAHDHLHGDDICFPCILIAAAELDLDDPR